VKIVFNYLFYARRPLNTGELLYALGVKINNIKLDKEAISNLQFLFGNLAGFIKINM
jgi:hypothetical protein